MSKTLMTNTSPTAKPTFRPETPNERRACRGSILGEKQSSVSSSNSRALCDPNEASGPTAVTPVGKYRALALGDSCKAKGFTF